jgi:hypothetical protein
MNTTGDNLAKENPETDDDPFGKKSLAKSPNTYSGSKNIDSPFSVFENFYSESNSNTDFSSSTDVFKCGSPNLNVVTKQIMVEFLLFMKFDKNSIGALLHFRYIYDEVIISFVALLLKLKKNIHILWIEPSWKGQYNLTFITVLLAIAHKLQDDSVEFNNHHYGSIVNISVETFNQIEANLLNNCLKWRLFITREECFGSLQFLIRYFS